MIIPKVDLNCLNPMVENSDIKYLKSFQDSVIIIMFGFSLQYKEWVPSFKEQRSNSDS